MSKLPEPLNTTMFYVFAFSLFASASAQMLWLGPCPNVTVQPLFDTDRWAGRWYEQARYFTLFQLGTRCNTFDYSPAVNGIIKAEPSFVESLTGEGLTIHRNITIPKPADPAIWLVDIPFAPPGLNDMRVLGTDYDDFAVIRSCEDFNLVHLVYAWILTREQHPSEFTMDKAWGIVDKNELERPNFWKTKQEDCGAKN